MKLTNASLFTKIRHRNKLKSKVFNFKCFIFSNSMETKLYNEKHTKTVLEGERQVVSKKLGDVKGDN